jgi:hypothetical protein
MRWSLQRIAVDVLGTRRVLLHTRAARLRGWAFARTDQNTLDVYATRFTVTIAASRAWERTRRKAAAPGASLNGRNYGRSVGDLGREARAKGNWKNQQQQHQITDRD